jgi:hypothetical protein
VQRQVLHQLGENDLALVHGSAPLVVTGKPNLRGTRAPRSSR